MSAHGDHHREEFDLPEHSHTYEPSDSNAKTIFIFGVASIFVLLLTIGGVQLYFDWFKEAQVEREVLTPPSSELKSLRAREERQLDGYGYVDKTKGMIRLPIDRSMEVLVKEAAENKLGYPTNAYAVKTPEQLAAAAAGSGQPVAAPAQATGNPVQPQGGSAAQAGHAAPTPPRPGQIKP